MTPTRRYLEEHAVNLRLAANVGLYAEGSTLYYPYERADGSKFLRRRDLAASEPKTIQAAGESLCCWWPVGGRDSKHILLTEGESDTLAAASVLCTDDAKPRRMDQERVHPLGGLCPVGLPGTSYARKAVEELRHADVVYVCLDGLLDCPRCSTGERCQADEPKHCEMDSQDRAGRQATLTLVSGLDATGTAVIPVQLPEGKDLADCLAEYPVIREREEWLGNTLLDAETSAEEYRHDAAMQDIERKLGRV